MMELTHELRYLKTVFESSTGPQDDVDEANTKNKKIKSVYITVNILSVTVLLIVCMNAYVLFGKSYKESMYFACYWFLPAYGLLSIMLTYSFCTLTKQTKTFSIDKSLFLKENRLLRQVFFAFTATYIMRELYGILMFFFLNNLYSTAPSVNFIYTFYLLSVVLPVGWDAIPIGL